MDVGDALPHDLLEVASAGAVAGDAPAPAWARASLGRAPFVVVRRARRRGDSLPVGVRGAARGERFAAWLPADSALRRIRPEDLRARRGWMAAQSPPLFDALEEVAYVMEALGLAWGPTGSVGFALATGLAAVTAASDLDVLARAPTELPRESARWLHARLAALPCPVDVQLETPAGAVVLGEYAASGPRVVLRTLDGPRLVVSPWAEAVAAEPGA